jgi:hypothetical protein
MIVVTFTYFILKFLLFLHFYKYFFFVRISFTMGNNRWPYRNICGLMFTQPLVKITKGASIAQYRKLPLERKVWSDWAIIQCYDWSSSSASVQNGRKTCKKFFYTCWKSCYSHSFNWWVMIDCLFNIWKTIPTFYNTYFINNMHFMKTVNGQIKLYDTSYGIYILS